jgi:hypothetical protein
MHLQERGIWKLASKLTWELLPLVVPGSHEYAFDYITTTCPPLFYRPNTIKPDPTPQQIADALGYKIPGKLNQSSLIVTTHHDFGQKSHMRPPRNTQRTTLMERTPAPRGVINHLRRRLNVSQRKMPPYLLKTLQARPQFVMRLR